MENDVLKEKANQLSLQVEYFKDSLQHKDHTLVELCRNREYTTAKDTSLRGVNSANNEFLSSDKNEFMYVDERRCSNEINDFNEVVFESKSVGGHRSLEKRQQNSFENSTRL